MTSCGGTFSVTVRRSTFTILSTTGMSRKRPGPFGGDLRRPSRKITPRSYSRATLTDAVSRNSRNSRMTAATMSAAITARTLRRNDVQPQVGADALHTNLRAHRDRAVGRSRAPELPVHEDGALGIELPAHHADLAA